MEKITFEGTVKNYLSANQLFYKSQKAAWCSPLFYKLCIATAMLLLINTASSIPGWLLLCLGGLGFSYPYSIMPFIVYYFYKRQSQFHGQITIEMNKTHILEKHAAETNKLTAIHDYIISEAMILILKTPQTFIYMPQEAIHSNEQYRRIKHLLSTFPKSSDHPAQKHFSFQAGNHASLIAFWVMSIMVLLAGTIVFSKNSFPDLFHNNTFLLMLIGGCGLTLFLAIIGMILGIIGLIQKTNDKRTALTGFIFNALVLITAVMLSFHQTTLFI